jgi:hypothetical protein
VIDCRAIQQPHQGLQPAEAADRLPHYVQGPQPRRGPRRSSTARPLLMPGPGGVARPPPIQSGEAGRPRPVSGSSATPAASIRRTSLARAEQHRQPLRPRPAGGEHQRIGRRPIHPLPVIDHTQRRPALRGRREQAKHRRPGIRSQWVDGTCQRPGLGFRRLTQIRKGRPQQPMQPSERQIGLARGWRGGGVRTQRAWRRPDRDRVVSRRAIWPTCLSGGGQPAAASRASARLLACGWLAECAGVRAGSSADPRGQDHLVTGSGCRWLRRGLPDDRALQKAVCAEIAGRAGGDALTRVKLADCGKSPAGELLAGLASVLGSAADMATGAGCVFVFAEHDPGGFARWAISGQLPAAWPQSTTTCDAPAALTRSPLACAAGRPGPSLRRRPR